MYQIVFWLDDFVLQVTKRVTGFIQRLSGYTNFDLAWIVLVFFFLFLSWVSGIVIRYQGLFFGLFYEGFIIWLFFGVRNTIIKERMQNRNTRFLNRNRTDIFSKVFRTGGVVITIVLSVKVALIMSGFSTSDLQLETVLSWIAYVCVLGIGYLLSVESEPPSESRIGRALRKLFPRSA